MDRIIISNFNKIVNNNDTVYYVGDFAMFGNSRRHYIKSIVNKLNGKKILIHTYINIGFESVHTSLRLSINKQKVVLAHDPAIKTVLNDDEIFICGHVHGLFKVLPDKKTVNVGVDNWDFKPVTIEQIIQVLE